MHQPVYIVGIHSTLDALQNEGAIEKIFIRFGASVPAEVNQHAQRQGIPIAILSRQKFDRLAQQIGATKHHQNIIALRRAYSMLEWAVICSWANRAKPPVVVACDHITDPHNFGAIVRTAAAADADAIVTTIHNSAPITPAAITAASGAFERIPIARVRSLVTALADAKDCGYWVIGTDSHGDRLYTDALYDRPLILVIGSEGSGMRRSIRRLCDTIVRIPLARDMESLNASVAAAIVLFELRRQRTTAVTQPASMQEFARDVPAE